MSIKKIVFVKSRVKKDTIFSEQLHEFYSDDLINSVLYPKKHKENKTLSWKSGFCLRPANEILDQEQADFIKKRFERVL